MLICEPVYGTYTDLIKPSSNGMEVNMASVIDKNKNTKIKIGTKSKYYKF